MDLDPKVDPAPVDPGVEAERPRNATNTEPGAGGSVHGLVSDSATTRRLMKRSQSHAATVIYTMITAVVMSRFAETSAMSSRNQTTRSGISIAANSRIDWVFDLITICSLSRLVTNSAILQIQATWWSASSPRGLPPPHDTIGHGPYLTVGRRS